MSTVLERPVTKPSREPARGGAIRTGIVDCDVHPTVKAPSDLRPYLSDRWWRHLSTYGPRPRHGFNQMDPYPKAAPRAARRDAWTPGGDKPGSDLAFMRENYLEACGIETAILSPLAMTGQGEQNVQFSAAMASATNDWQLDTWTRQEDRLKASIVVPYEDAAMARDEIDRRASDPHFKQILVLSRTSEPLGKRRYWPIFEAACRHDLPIGVHVFGYSGYPVSSAGWPSFYIEEMSGHSTTCQTLVASMVLEGVFEEFPKLKVVLIEGGFGWLPSLAWRLDKQVMRSREEVPHLTRAPSDYIRDHFWITTQPMEEPEKRQHLLDAMGWIGFDRLLYATDYPHWDFDDPAHALPRGLDPERLEMIRRGNARKVYGLD
jgi:predicted TIM-barrel fold metal-dependent hydrolase